MIVKIMITYFILFFFSFSSLAEKPDLVETDSQKKEVSLELETDSKEKEAISSEDDSKVSEKNKSEDFSDEAFFLEEKQEDPGVGSVDMFWKASFNPTLLFDSLSTSTILKTDIHGRLRWRILETFFLESEVLLLGRNGFNQSIYDRDDRGSGISILEVLFEWKPSDQSSLKFGSLKQDFFEMPLLISDRTFPSLVSSWNFKENKDWKFVLRAAIPENASGRTTRAAQLIKGVPLFLTASLLLHEEDFFNFYVQDVFSFYSYYNLPPSVAVRSRTFGNTTEYEGDDTKFAYPFLGIHNNLRVRKELDYNWIAELGTEGIFNFLAPNTLNEGARVYSAFYHNYKDFMEVKVGGEVFFNQSDASVAYYNSEVYGRSNRRGFLASLQGHFYESRLTIGASLGYTDPIRPKPHYPERAVYISFFITTNYIAI